ncbi:WxcM-like domain-containing protein [Nitrosopumilus sp. S6]
MTSDHSSFDLEDHFTKDIFDGHVNGKLTVVWRDWDSKFKIDPKMIYVTTVNPGEKKGPHLHTKRDSFMTCISGKVVFVIKDKNGNYDEIISGEENPVLVHVPKNISSAHINISKQNSIVLVLANVSWKPDDGEMKNVLYEEYDWEKWKVE